MCRTARRVAERWRSERVRGVEVAGEAVDVVEPEVVRVREQVRPAEVVLVGEEQLVQRPERLLLPGASEALATGWACGWTSIGGRDAS